MKMLWQHDDGIDEKRVPLPNVPKSSAQNFDMLGQKTRPPVSQIDREKIATAMQPIAPIIRH